MMKQNETLPDIEKLGRHEFDLDIEEQNRLQAEADAEVTRVCMRDDGTEHHYQSDELKFCVKIMQEKLFKAFQKFYSRASKYLLTFFSCPQSIAAHRHQFVRDLSVRVSVCLSGNQTFLVVTHSNVLQVTHAYLRMLPFWYFFFYRMLI